MRCQQHLCPQQCGRADILNQVIVPTDQHPHSDTPWGVEHGETVAAGDCRVFKGMQFTVNVKLAVG
ncbi:hypothetical protein D3C71_1625540 [compost metagenome]